MSDGTDLLQAERMAEVPAAVMAGQLDLASAWERVSQKGGMPGADGVAVSIFGRSAAASLHSLQCRLASQTYRPKPLRMAELEKKPGGTLRLLLVPAVVDRIALGAVAQWLSSKWNASFDPSSFAYRPGLGVHDALRKLAEERDHGYRWVLDADIRSFFDSIDHSLLLEKIKRWLGESSPMLNWIRRWVKAAVWDGAELTALGRGVPQGSPLSPILANFYLHQFDRRLRAAKIHFVRYADDFLVLARTPFELAESRLVVEKALGELHLTLSSEKTRTTSFAQGFRFLGAEVQGERIMLPFEKKKFPRSPHYVAPVMPRALLQAYDAGRLLSSRQLDWNSANRRRRPLHSPEVHPGHRSNQSLRLLSGPTEADTLSRLREKAL